MPVKGSKSTAAKVVKKIKKDLAAFKKPISKAAKKIAKDISAARKPLSKVAKKLSKDISSIRKPASKKAGKKVATGVAAVKKPVAKKSKSKKATRKVGKVVRKSVKSLAKKKPALKSRGKMMKASVKKAGGKPKKSVKRPVKAKRAKAKKAVKSKASGSAKSKKPGKKAKAVKKSKSAKEEKREKTAKPLKKKLVKTISRPISGKVAPRKAVKKVGPARNKASSNVSVRAVSGPTLKTVGKPPSIVSVMKVPATSFMSAEIPPYREKAGEEYMNEAQQKHFQKLLYAWKDQLVRDMVTTVHHMQDEAANFPDPNDRATQEEEFSLELRTRDRELKLVKKIEEALHKLDNHEYGYCESCGVKIGIRRLEARPTATLCIDCKTLDEIREKQLMG